MDSSVVAQCTVKLCKLIKLKSIRETEHTIKIVRSLVYSFLVGDLTDVMITKQVVVLLMKVLSTKWFKLPSPLFPV